MFDSVITQIYPPAPQMFHALVQPRTYEQASSDSVIPQHLNPTPFVTHKPFAIDTCQRQVAQCCAIEGCMSFCVEFECFPHACMCSILLWLPLTVSAGQVNWLILAQPQPLSQPMSHCVIYDYTRQRFPISTPDSYEVMSPHSSLHAASNTCCFLKIQMKPSLVESIQCRI